MFKLYSDQQKVCNEALSILEDEQWVYLALECQIGKTHISLAICEQLKAKSVLVVTVKNVVTGRGFENDYDDQGCTFDLATINYESAHKFQKHDFDILIIDEAHSLGAFPTMTMRSKILQTLKKKAKKVIFLSATPTPESYSQWFHQLIGLESPLSQFKSFYKFKDVWVTSKQVKVSATRTITQYHDCKPELNDLLRSNVISMTYDYAMFSRWVNRELSKDVATLRYGGVFGLKDLNKPFKLNDNESYRFDGKHVIPCDEGQGLKESTVEDCFVVVDTSHEVCQGPFTVIRKVKSKDGDSIVEEKHDTLTLKNFESILRRDSCIYIGDDLVTAEGGSSMLTKTSQISSGILIDDQKQTHILSDIKIRKGLEHFEPEKRLAIFYFFIGEKNLIKSVLGDDVTDNLADFQAGKTKHFMVHFRSGKAGIRLADADELVMFNVPYSFEQWYQARQRRSALLKEGKELKVWWIMTTHGIEQQIFNVVVQKQDYTLNHYLTQR